MIRSMPPAAKVYVNGTYIGLTPAPYAVSRSEFHKGDFKVRVERAGYQPAEGTLQTTLCPGRIAGAVFTLGIVFIFKGPTCFVFPQDFPLTPLS